MASFSQFPVVSVQYQLALSLVATMHQYQIRKDATPYLGHLLSVSALVMEMSCTEETAIAALFHDAIEDLENPTETISLIQEKFGKYVLEIVLGVTEQKELPKPERKLAYIQQVKDSPLEVVYVSFADKFHNWVNGYARQPELVDKSVIEFYQQLIPVFEQRLHNQVARFYLSMLVESFEKVTG
ncbi:HD domain-containing protein [Laspinema palackyanum]|uniref:HD domain-containing protein n=1 Tax=Laspinema palackyanum TaxID=3231601 RepID=UPI00345C954E|nr:HD domain-containing protein [Laspinema sp. D2c]